MHAVLTRVDTHTSVSVDRERRRAILCRLDPEWTHTSVSVDRVCRRAILCRLDPHAVDTHFCERRRTLLRIENWYAMLKSSNENETNCPLTVA